VGLDRELPPLNAIRAFECVARSLSFTRASAELRVTQSAVSRQVNLLEEYLGVKLFKRHGRSVELTVDGREYFAPLREALEQISLATSRIKADGTETKLTVNVPPSVAVLWLIPRIAGLSAKHPNIDLHLVTSVEPLNPSSDNFDVAIRLGRFDGKMVGGQEPGPVDLGRVEMRLLSADYLFPYEIIPVCSPKLTSCAESLDGYFVVRHSNWLNHAQRPSQWADWFRANGWPWKENPRSANYSNLFMIVQAAIAGHGVALVPKILVADALADGSLVELSAPATQTKGAYYLLTRKRHRDTRKVRRFREWILETAAEWQRDAAPAKATGLSQGRPARSKEPV
jgi:LysR family glycine cleavage system transcriptional activator